MIDNKVANLREWEW